MHINYKIYYIYRIDTGDVIYIGLTKKSLYARLSAHFSDKRRNKRKVNYFKKYKNFLEIGLLEELIPSLEEANKWEKIYIARYRKMGHNLLNATDGGDGTAGMASWNKGVECTYKEALMDNSPNKKEVHMYTSDGEYLQSFNSIKKAHEATGIPRFTIKQICELKPRFKTYKGKTFRYFKALFVDVNIMSEDQRIERLREAKTNNSRRVKVIFRSSNLSKVYKNVKECAKSLGIKTGTVYWYIKDNSENKKYKIDYV